MLARIQNAILDSSVSISDALRMAVVLAHQLKSNSLRQWAEKELNGYTLEDQLPDYRNIHTTTAGTATNGAWIHYERLVPLSSIDREDLKIALTQIHIREGIRTVEGVATARGGKFAVSGDVLEIVNQVLKFQGGYRYTELHYVANNGNFAQIVDSVRNRLLAFVLELGEEWRGEIPPPPQEVEHLVNILIHNSAPGGNMTTYDQRGQQVNSQYNAGRDINIGPISNQQDLLSELVRLQEEIVKAKEVNALSNDVAVEAEYHILQASKESQKEAPNKPTLRDHLEKAKGVLMTSAAGASIIHAIAKVAELADKLF